MATRRPAMFIGSDGSYHDDPTAPLRRAKARGDIGLWAWGRDNYPGEQLTPADYPGLLSAGLWEVEADQDWGLDWHTNEGVEITFVTRGRVGFASMDEERELQRGWMTVTRPWQRHRIGAPHVTACTLGWFVLDVDALRPNQDWAWPAWLPLPIDDRRRLTDGLRGHEGTVWPVSVELMSAFERLERTMRGQYRHTVPRLALSITEVLLELTDLLERTPSDPNPYYSSSERTVELFLAALPTRLAEQWTVDSMADACGLGRTRFIHYCRLAVNASPLDYLNGLRVDKALDLLLSTNQSITDVAYACGFSSSQYFATAFRRGFDCAPSEARRLGRAARTSADRSTALDH